MATQIAKKLRIHGPNDSLPMELVLAAVGAAGSTETVAGADSDKAASKRAVVRTFTVNGQSVYVLTRVEFYGGSIFLDVIMSQSIAELTTTVAALSLGALGTGHPAPTKDYVDAQAMVAAGGS